MLEKIGCRHGTDKVAHGYLPVYKREIRKTERGALLEIGWYEGASMRMWRDWFYGWGWKIVGLDIEPKDPIDGVHFFQGDQTSPVVRDRIRDYVQTFDVIIDDASHLSPQTAGTFTLYWPLVKPGGLYFIEDLHVSYHPAWNGFDPTGDRMRRGAYESTMQRLQRLTDDVHFGHAEAGPGRAVWTDIAQVSFWPGLCMIRKAS